MSKKRKAPASSRVTNARILRKSFEHLVETLPIVTIRCSDGEVSTKLLWFYRDRSEFIAHMYDVPNPMDGIELIADEFCRNEVDAVIEIISANRTRVLKKGDESGYDPALTVGVLKFFNKHLMLASQRGITATLLEPYDLTRDDQVDFIHHYIERGLDVGDGYYQNLICQIAKDVPSYSALLKPHHKLFAEAGVYEQICHAGTSEKG